MGWLRFAHGSPLLEVPLSGTYAERRRIRSEIGGGMSLRKLFQYFSSIFLLATTFGCGGSSTTQPLPPFPITVSVTPATATVQTGSTDKLVAIVSNDSSQSGVRWSV